jgi:hypothetical protein
VDGIIEELECPHDILLTIIEVIKGRVLKFKGGEKAPLLAPGQNFTLNAV